MTRVIFYACIAVLWAGTASASTFRVTYQKTINAGGNPILSVSNATGDITVTGSSAHTIVIDAVKSITADTEAEAEKLEEYLDINVNKQGNQITVVTTLAKEGQREPSLWDRLFGRKADPIGRVDFAITVPYTCQVQLAIAAGDMTVSDIANDVTASGASGTITLRNIRGPLVVESNSGALSITQVQGDIDIASTGSSISLADITGRTEVRTTSGLLTGVHLDGPIKITNTSGTIELTNLIGDLRVKSTSGDIIVAQQSGGIDIQTHSGEVIVETEMNSDLGYYVETISGNITFKVPERASGTLHLQSVNGEINTEHPVTIRSFTKNKLIGDFGESGPKVSLATESGDILFGQYQETP